LLLTLFKFVDGNGVCYPSYNTLQPYTKMSRHTLCKHIKSLNDSGWIAYETGDKSKGQSNTYELNLERMGLTTETNVVPMQSSRLSHPMVRSGIALLTIGNRDNKPFKFKRHAPRRQSERMTNHN
ncbi:helix-turn-helix domain-containing protein, partial [Vibrio parahaemolyticus]|uniref:helix-turn-helix domain-containing protein n=1 Tax=Vibrio parahaemolyticus TaxID=670 RepID=UPI00111296BA